MNTINTGWIKVYYSYKRNVDNSYQQEYSMFSNKPTDFENVKKVLQEYFEDFAEQGKIIIRDVETGACKENELSEKETSYFRRKIYTFNN